MLNDLTLETIDNPPGRYRHQLQTVLPQSPTVETSGHKVSIMRLFACDIFSDEESKKMALIDVMVFVFEVMERHEHFVFCPCKTTE